MGSTAAERDGGEEAKAAEAPRILKKGKSLSVFIPSAAGDDPFDEEKKNKDKVSSDAAPLARTTSRSTSSKYDFVKVKVWLGDNADHYYVLSRFLLSRMLTVTKIPNHVAIKIALELKKLLIDNSLLDVSQSDLEANLFKLMERRGYGEEYINRYKMMTRFHHQRVPLVILVCGTACAGKSTIATQLAQRLNLPNVLQTDMVYELLRTSTDAPLTSTPVWARDFNSSEELITEFCRECRVVRKGLAGDLKKAMKDGKPIIIEGIHLDPSIYLLDDGKRDLVESRKKENDSGTLRDESELNSNSEKASGQDDVIKKTLEMEGTEGAFASQIILDVDRPLSAGLTENISEHGNCHEESEIQENDSGKTGSSAADSEAVHPGSDLQSSSNPLKQEKSAAEPIVVPIVLKMAEFDHKALLEEWISTRTFVDKSLLQDQDKLISNLKTIQDYLCSFQSQGLMVVNISATSFTQTLDFLHNYLLQCIERGISPAPSKDIRQGETE